LQLLEARMTEKPDWVPWIPCMNSVFGISKKVRGLYAKIQKKENCVLSFPVLDQYCSLSELSRVYRNILFKSVMEYYPAKRYAL